MRYCGNMRPYLSYSQLALYLECPLKYRFRYVDEIKCEGVSSALVFGKAIHQALAAFYTDVMEQRPFWFPRFLVAFEEAWEEVCDEAEVVFKEGEDFQTLLDYGKEMLRVFARCAMPMKVIAVEVPFEFRLENPETGQEFPIPLKGVIDLIEEDEQGTLWVVDHKTAKRAFSDHQIDADLQMCQKRF